MINEQTSNKVGYFRLAFVACLLTGGLALAGCQERGPAEEAGAELDDMMSDAQRSLRDARDEVEDAVDR